MDKATLANEVKQLARKLGAKLVGIAPVGRFKNAPLLHSPQGLLPTAKSVVVVGVPWLDASAELTEKELSEHFYNVGDKCEQETNMNQRLYSITFALAKLLEKQGCGSLPIPPTLYWRWRPYKTMKETFAPPLVHRYAAVAAGLGDIGWHESFISPEYGPRVRVSSLITEAELEADPLYEGAPLCDKCMRCVKACPYDRFRKEVSRTVKLDIGGKIIEIPVTNKWRCYLCYSGINPRFLPNQITEEAALRITSDDRVPKQDGGWIMDSMACITACLPPHLRQKDENLYANSVARKREAKAADVNEVVEKLKEMARAAGTDLYIGTKAEFLEKGINLEDYMPTASALVLFGTSYSDQFMNNASKEKLKNLLYDMSHYLQEFGSYTLPASRLAVDSMREVFGLKENQNTNFHHLITAMPLPSLKLPVTAPKSGRGKSIITSTKIKKFALGKGADLVGISSVERLDAIYASLKNSIGVEKTFVVENKSAKFLNNSVPDITAKSLAEVIMKKPRDYLANAKSVIVVGIHYPYALLETAGKPPAENIGPYASMERWFRPEFLGVAYDIVKFLNNGGYQATATFDLEGLGFPGHTANRYTALAAGLGEIGWCGAVLTPEYGYAQRFVSIVTDAELGQDKLYGGPKLCQECAKCLESCPVNAINKNTKARIEIEGRVIEFAKIDRLRCEWANRFGLVAAEGPGCMGSKINIMPPENITAESFNAAIKKAQELEVGERINCNITFEKCLSACPVKGSGRA